MQLKTLKTVVDLPPDKKRTVLVK